MNVAGNELSHSIKTAPIAVIEALLGLVIMAIIIKSVIKRNYCFTKMQLKEDAQKVNSGKVFILYLVSTLTLSSIGFIFGQQSGVAQILVTFQGFKWVFFLFYGYIIWILNEKKYLFLISFIYEFITAFYSYFSDFKLVIFFFFIIVLTFVINIKLKQFFIIITTGIILLFFFLTWSAIKRDYRKFLSGGKREQKVKVSREDAYTNLNSQFYQLDSKQYEKAVFYSLYRMQYILHLAKVMDRIPSIAPHENGKVWLQNIEFVLLPRALFPEKGIYDPSVKTNKFTGYKYATAKLGTAFSLGYFADSYVDFGHGLMYFPIILIAFFVSAIYMFFITRSNLNILFRYAIITSILFTFSSFEADGTFLIGRLFISSIVMVVMTYTLFPLFQRWVLR